MAVLKTSIAEVERALQKLRADDKIEIDQDKDAYFVYLDELSETGATNGAIGATPHLMKKFPELDQAQASHILEEWMETFGARHQSDRAAEWDEKKHPRKVFAYQDGRRALLKQRDTLTFPEFESFAKLKGGKTPRQTPGGYEVEFETTAKAVQFADEIEAKYPGTKAILYGETPGDTPIVQVDVSGDLNNRKHLVGLK